MIHIRTIASFAPATALVWRSFDHLIVPGPGTLLLVPVVEVDGDMTGVIDGCPVPWAEAWAVIDTPPAQPVALSPERLGRLAPALASRMAPHGWMHDVVPAQAMVPTMTRLVGPDGVRFAMLGDGEG